MVTLSDLDLAKKDLPALTKIRILRGHVDHVTLSQAIEHVKALLKTGEPHQIVTANTLMLLATEHDLELTHILEKASLALPESWGVAWASRRLGTPLGEFIPGIDFLLALCRLAEENKQSIYLLGAEPGISKKASQTLLNLFPGLAIAGFDHGYFSQDEEGVVIDRIREAKPTFLFVGMNVPYQEKWISRHLRALNVPIAMGVGGSFDVLSGRLRRAPLWMRRLGVEWVFRTLQQPWRLRRIKDLPVFMWKVLCFRNDFAENL